MQNWKVSILTIFPEIFPGPLAHSIAGKALDKKLFSLNVFDIRDYATDKHKTVDDKIFGGGAGMLMRPDVISNAIEAALKECPDSKLVYFTPRGKKFTQKIAKELIQEPSVLMLCGRYEGVDQRIFAKYDFLELSIGDYVLSGGEMAALVAIDSCIRLIPGVIDNEEVNAQESFAEGEFDQLLEYDQYTRPAIWDNKEVPEVLLSGNHQQIAKWRLDNAIANTKKRRPDLSRKATD